jgi:pimeloyl-ACP methyl ester carboxylesterase
MHDFPKAETIRTNGINMAVHQAGKGKPIVLCHGWPEMAFSWRYQIQPLVDAGYHVIAPDQRGYTTTDQPEAVEDYDVHQLSADLTGLLDHYGYDDALFVGHDWGAIVLWNLAMLHPSRVAGLIQMSVPFMERGKTEWVAFWESMLGPDFYIVHFNRQPGVAATVFENNTKNFLNNLYRTEQWLDQPKDYGPGMSFINMASDTQPTGRSLLSEAELDVFVQGFKASGFHKPINWYRNFTRNWETMADVRQQIDQPALMIYGKHDMVPPSENLAKFVPNVEETTLDCGHWIQQEKPAETTALMLSWLNKHYPA